VAPLDMVALGLDQIVLRVGVELRRCQGTVSEVFSEGPP
jgi:hypothetical protein